jgi:hypothetical protein
MQALSASIPRWCIYCVVGNYIRNIVQYCGAGLVYAGTVIRLRCAVSDATGIFS